MVNTADLTMTQIKSFVLQGMIPGEAIDPLTLIERLHVATRISSYDLKAAIWYLIGDQRIRLDDSLNIVRVDRVASSDQ